MLRAVALGAGRRLRCAAALLLFALRLEAEARVFRVVFFEDGVEVFFSLTVPCFLLVEVFAWADDPFLMIFVAFE
jgi:hypothetical protein